MIEEGGGGAKPVSSLKLESWVSENFELCIMLVVIAHVT